jgi:hypothetical protein
VFNKRVQKLERVIQGYKDASNSLIIITPIGVDDGNLAVKINGETLFTGKPEECDMWIEKNIGPTKNIRVGVPDRL